MKWPLYSTNTQLEAHPSPFQWNLPTSPCLLEFCAVKFHWIQLKFNFVWHGLCLNEGMSNIRPKRKLEMIKGYFDDLDIIVSTDTCGRSHTGSSEPVPVPVITKPQWRLAPAPASWSMCGSHMGIGSYFYPMTSFNWTGEIAQDLTRGFPMESPLEPVGDPHKLRSPFLQPNIALVMG